MAKQKNNLNNKGKEYIEDNLWKQDPQGLPEVEELNTNEKIVISQHVPVMKRFIFINNRDPGYPLDFHYHSATHHLKHYTLYHGLEHELPEEIIDHLESCAENQYGYRKGINGQPEHYVKGQKYNFRCQPVKRAA